MTRSGAQCLAARPILTLLNWMRHTPTVLITGATGFIGRHYLALLAERGRDVIIASRTDRPAPVGVREVRAIGDLAAASGATESFGGVDAVVHLAGHVAVKDSGPVEDSVNVRMARAVAERALAANVPRVIVLSSIAASVAERMPHRARRYGLEKLAADAVFREILPSKQVLFLRPPAVYGPGMAGPLATLGRIVARGLPIPLGRSRADRSYISVKNLADLLDVITCSCDSAWTEAAGHIYEPSDGDPVRTNELIRMIGSAVGTQARLLPVPLSALRLLGHLTGRSEMISGAIDPVVAAGNEPLSRIFGWIPSERMPKSLSFLRAEPWASVRRP